MVIFPSRSYNNAPTCDYSFYLKELIFPPGFRIGVRFRAGTLNGKRISCVLLGPRVKILSLGLTVLGVFTCTSKHAQNCQT